MRVGLAYRSEFEKDWDQISPHVEVLEITPEHFFEQSPSSLAEFKLRFQSLELRAHTQLLSIASVRRPSQKKLDELKRILDFFEIYIVSDHFSFMATGTAQLGNFLPPLLTSEGKETLATNLLQAENFLGRSIQLENIVYFLPWQGYQDQEVESLAATANQSGGVLLDVNNLFVNSRNHKFCPKGYLEKLAQRDCVRQIHIAGHMESDGLWLDSHMHSISDEVLLLLDQALNIPGIDAVVLERDNASARTAELVSELALLGRRLSKR